MSFFHKLKSFFHNTGGGIADKADFERDLIERILKEELDNKVTQAILNMQKDAAQELVGNVIIPVLDVVLKPATQIGFAEASSAVGVAVDIMEKIAGREYKPPKKIVERAREYTTYAGDRTDWWRLLIAFGDEEAKQKHPDLSPMTLAEGRQQLRVWGGWYPFVQQLRFVDNAQHIIDDLNGMSIYLSAKTNLTVGCYFNNLYDRGEFLKADLHEWSRRGLPLTRSGINEMLLELGPDKLELTEEAKIAFGIVIGESAGLWSIPTSLFLPYIDDVMKQLGVPE